MSDKKEMGKLKLTLIVIGSLILYALVFILILGGWFPITYPFFKILEAILNMGGGG